MRVPALVAVLLATSATARADTVVSLDVGYLWDRVAVTDHTAIDGRLVRFGFRVAFDTIHIGAEVDDSWLQGTTTVPDGAIARTSMVPAGSPVEGTMVAPKLVVGAHTRLHRAFSLAAEVAGGVRDTGVDTDLVNDAAGRKMEPLVEARGRLEWWFAPSWSIGAMGSADVFVRDDVSFGLMLATNL